MTDKTAVVNQALALLGERLIADFDEATPRAEKCRAFYESTVDAVFEAYPWPFARNRKRLTVNPEYTQLAGKTAFVLPRGFRRAVHPTGEGYTREGEFYLASETGLSLTFVERKPEGVWPAHFVKTVAAYLAGELAYPICESTTKASQMYALYADRLRRARGAVGEVQLNHEAEDLQRAHG
jgi:hypothetical protein